MKIGKAEWILLGITAVLLAASAAVYIVKDKTAPAFLYSEVEIVYHEGDDPSVLLAGLRATDEEDGDVTDRIFVDNVIPLFEKEQAKVFYVVSDQAGSVAKISRIVKYKAADSNSSTQGGSIPASAPVSSANKPGQSEPETSKADEEETSKGTAEETESSTGRETAQTTTAAAGQDGFPVLKLTTNEVTLSVGDTFSYYNYVESVSDDKDSRSDLFRRINILGDYDTSVPGEYELTIYVVDSDGNRSNREKLTLIVE